jgi:TM2 domain-containing membrane protein YozV
MAQYYIGKDNQQLGPFEINQLLSNGLTPDTLVWCAGMSGWEMAKNVPELAGLFVAQQPQQPQYNQGYQQPAYQQPQYQQPQYQQPQYQQPQYQQPQYQQPQYQQQPAYMAGAYQQPMGGGASRQKVDMFMMANKDDFPSEKLPYIQERLSMVDDNTINSISMLSFKNPTTALLLSIFAGGFGVDRFYIGDTGIGIGKLLTAGGCGIWAIIDLFLIMGATREKNYEMLAPYI